MKKFYSIIAAFAIGSMISASAFSTVGKVEKKIREDLPNVEVSKVEQSLHQMSQFKAVASRDDEGTDDLTSFTQALFYDYFYNWEIPNAGALRGSKNEFNDAESYRDLVSSCSVSIENNGDGTFTMVGINGYNMNITLRVTEDGRLVADAGEVIFKNGGYNFVLAAAYYENQSFRAQTTGEIPFTVYRNAIVPECDGLGAYAFTETGEAVGWGFLSLECFYYAPNATLSFTVKDQDEEGNTITKEINNRVYAEFREANPEAESSSVNSFDRIFVSNVNPDNNGIGVNFLIADDIIATMDAVAAQYSYGYDQTGQIINTGDFYISYLFEESGKLYFTPEYVGASSVSDTQLTWPTYIEGMISPNLNGQWGVFSEIGFGLVLANGATLTLDGEGSENGISDIISDNSVDSPAVYYNLQGVEVANPAAGQIYIIKKGDKVSKQIIK